MCIEEVVEILKMHRNAFVAEHRGSAITAFDIAINTLSAPHEMTAREYHNIAKRMLDTDMGAFKLWWDMMRWLDDKALTFAEKWAWEHPEEANDVRSTTSNHHR